MKTVYLIRHAKSSWKYDELSDYERPLNKRGKCNAKEMGYRLSLHNIIPDYIIASPAVRARSTARKIAKQIEYPKKDIIYHKDLYFLESESYLSIMQDYLQQVESVAVVGHNMAITDLAERLTGQVIENVVTAGVVAISLSCTSGGGVEIPGQFLFYDFPKNSQSPLLREENGRTNL